MQIAGGAAPIPQRHHDVAFNALWALRFRERQFTVRDPVRPVGEHLQRALGVEPADVARHEELRLARRQTPLPGLNRRFELTEVLGKRPRPGRAERMARAAGADLDDVEPLALTLDLGHGELARRRRIEERPPVHGGIILGRVLLAAPRNCSQVEVSSRRRLHLR